MSNLRVTPFYPFLFAAYPFLNLLSVNILRLKPAEVLPYILLSLGVTFAVWLVLVLILRDVARSSFLVMVLQFLFFSYGHIYGYLIDSLRWTWVNYAILGAVWICIGVGAVLTQWRFKKNIRYTTTFFNVMAAVLVIFPLFTIVSHVMSNETPVSQNQLYSRELSINDEAAGYEELPDIYYIVLDAYGRQDILRDYYQYDNEDFISALEELGFYIAEQSNTNYLQTEISLASSLNLDYIQNLLGDDFDAIASGSYGGQPLYALVQNNSLCRTLKEIGYTYLLTDSGWEITNQSDCADSIRSPNVQNATELETILIEGTLLRPFMSQSVELGLREVRLFAFDDLPAIAELKDPTFTFAHIILPHHPYIFDRDGNPVNMPNFAGTMQFLPPELGINPETFPFYADQAYYTSQRTLEAVRQILERSDVPPIIIIQGDHGVFPDAPRGSDRYFQMRLPILNAYFLPNGVTENLYPSITPVNSFRYVLNQYFNANLELLEDQTYYASGFYDYVDVTLQTIYEDEQLKIRRSWSGDVYSIQRVSSNGATEVGTFQADDLLGVPLEITGADQWAFTITSPEPSTYQVVLYDPTGQASSTGSFSLKSERDRYGLIVQDYENFENYRQEVDLPFSEQAVMVPELVSEEERDQAIIEVGRAVSLRTHATIIDQTGIHNRQPLAEGEEEIFFDLLLLLERASSETELSGEQIPEIAAWHENLAPGYLMQAGIDYILVSKHWIQEQQNLAVILQDPHFYKLVQEWDVLPTRKALEHLNVSLGYYLFQPVNSTLTAANIALSGSVTASREESNSAAINVLDSDPRSVWNAGAPAPQWIEIDLQGNRTITTLQLTVSQFPEGHTTHNVWGRSLNGDYQLLHVFEGNTASGQILNYSPSTPWEGIRYIKIETVESPSWVAWFNIAIIGTQG